jgi:excisionase family DNA binding protein
MKQQNHALSVLEFCEQYGISRSFFYKLRKQGKAPRTLNIGRRRLITSDAILEWEQSNQTPHTL